MIDVVPHPDMEHGALAHDLLRRAVSAFAAIAPDERDPSLVALDAFLARPAPATYLSAVRILAEARRAAARAGYALARGLDTVRRELGADTAEALGAIPADDRAGMRLRALALLSAAHRELAGRVAGSAELLRRQLELSRDKTASVPAPRRRPPPRLTRSGR
jgi:hypothetical protein